MWHYVKDGAATGPVAEDELRNLLRDGAVPADTLVWTKGMVEWQTARAAGLVEDAAEADAPGANGPPPPPRGPLPAPAGPAPAPATSGMDARTMSVLAHVLGLLTGFLGPLVILLVTQDASVKAHARRALNWQISLTIYIFASFLLMFILIGFLFIFALFVLDLVLCILAAVKAGDRVLWNYPMTITFVKD